MERVALSLAERYHDEGIPTLLLTCRHLRENPSLEQSVRPQPFEIVRLPVLQRSPLLDLTWVIPGALRLYRRRFSLKAVIAHQAPTSGALASLVASRSDLRFAVVTHGARRDGDAALLRRMPLCRWRVAGVNRSEFVTSFNPETDRELTEVGIRPERIRRVPNGCDTEAFRPPTPHERRQARERLGLPPGRPTVAFVGRLAAGKRLEILIRAVAALPDVALLEAMACGLPAVVSDVAANREVLTDDADGLLVGGAEPGRWKSALEALAGDEGRRRRLGQAARRTVESKFRLRDVQRFYLDWFQRL